jgi:hypothetical protein
MADIGLEGWPSSHGVAASERRRGSRSHHTSIAQLLACIHKLAKRGISTKPICPASATHVYRYRSAGAVLEQFEELEKQEIYFSATDDLNDPMEGFKDVFWAGDEIVWAALLKHYVFCLLAVTYCACHCPPKSGRCCLNAGRIIRNSCSPMWQSAQIVKSINAVRDIQSPPPDCARSGSATASAQQRPHRRS